MQPCLTLSDMTPYLWINLILLFLIKNIRLYFLDFCENGDWLSPNLFHLPAQKHFLLTWHLPKCYSPLAQRIPGTGEPDGLLSMGSQRVGHDWSDLAAAAAQRTLGWSGLVRFSSSLFPMCFYGKVNSSCFRAFPFDSQGPFLLSTKTGALQIKGFGFQKYCFSCGLQEPILNVRKLNFDCFILTLSLHIPVLPILILLEAIPLIF